MYQIVSDPESTHTVLSKYAHWRTPQDHSEPWSIPRHPKYQERKQAAVSLQPYMLYAICSVALPKWTPRNILIELDIPYSGPQYLNRISQKWLSKPANTANMRTALFGRFTVVCLVGSR